MKKNILLTILLLIFGVVAVSAQTQPEKNFIEVTGSAETLVTPNEFIFQVILYERIENKQKLTIEKQEDNLKAELTRLGVEVSKDFTVHDILSVYISRRKTKDTLGSKEYRLKIKDLEKIERLQEIADKLNIGKLEFLEATHSNLTELRKQTKIEAIKAAKAKAEYLLSAIGEKVGKAIYVKEIADGRSDENSNFRSNNIRLSSNGTSVGREDSPSESLGFTQIKLRFEIFAKFEIQ